MFSLLLSCYWGGGTARGRGEYVQGKRGGGGVVGGTHRQSSALE